MSLRTAIAWTFTAVLACIPLALASVKSDISHEIEQLSASLEAKGQPYCSPSGPISDACCEFRTIQRVNSELSPLLAELVTTSFFRYWKTNLHKDCPFWQENPLCILRDCSVVEADESEIPEHWKTSALSSVDQSPLDNGFSLMTKSCQWSEADFCAVEDDFSTEGCYINLLKNPERFTGFGGESAARIWGAIYRENCFNLFENNLEGTLTNTRKELQNTCMEKRVFYRLLSGLHASISTHICDQWLDRKSGEWIRNLTCFSDRVGNHPDRVQNLYFTYTMMVRAVAKLAPYLRNHQVHQFCTGSGADTHRIEDLVEQVADKAVACGPTFDEKTLFVDSGSMLLKEEFKTHFRNISQIMDCVGCEKCRLWGKLQISGLGTALKILFSYDDNPMLYRLTRGEVVALFNTLNRLSESVAAVDEFRAMHQKQAKEDKVPEQSNGSAGPDKIKDNPKLDTEPKDQLPPLPLLDMFSYTRLSDPRHYLSYTIGFVIVVFGVVRIIHRAWKLNNGTLKLPAEYEYDADGHVVKKEEAEVAKPSSSVKRVVKLEKRRLGKQRE
ncbi:hypothetical protein SpCBS45565_g02075 [Spizellomyces sp. 'palustris']|nr:hypothetical protein SpCBS45565_g02075 [Spizellomyces sp. 'palustris']